GGADHPDLLTGGKGDRVALCPIPRVHVLVACVIGAAVAEHPEDHALRRWSRDGVPRHHVVSSVHQVDSLTSVPRDLVALDRVPEADLDAEAVLLIAPERVA